MRGTSYIRSKSLILSSLYEMGVGCTHIIRTSIVRTWIMHALCTTYVGRTARITSTGHQKNTPYGVFSGTLCVQVIKKIPPIGLFFQIFLTSRGNFWDIFEISGRFLGICCRFRDIFSVYYAWIVIIFENLSLKFSYFLRFKLIFGSISRIWGYFWANRAIFCRYEPMKF